MRKSNGEPTQQCKVFKKNLICIAEDSQTKLQNKRKMDHQRQAVRNATPDPLKDTEKGLKHPSGGQSKGRNKLIKCIFYTFDYHVFNYWMLFFFFLNKFQVLEKKKVICLKPVTLLWKFVGVM